MSLKNQTVFITGASRGIGRAIALRCARDGANVVIAAKSNEPHPKLGGSIHSVAAEVEAAESLSHSARCSRRSGCSSSNETSGRTFWRH